jgi:carotenoid cleavage dioxygenase-like enzyme
MLELPRIDYRERNGRPYRYVYGAGIHRGDGVETGDFLNQIVKVDIESGEATTWWEPGAYPGEAVFVAAPATGGVEDAGVLLSVVLASLSPSSYLLVLDAATMEELGRARVPHHIPFGFHGQYFS